MSISVVATIKVKDDEDIGVVGRVLGQFSRRAPEEGAIRYEVILNEPTFYVIEVWPDRTTLKNHLTTPEFQKGLDEEIVPRLDGSVEKPLDVQIHEGEELTLQDVIG